MKIKTLLIPAIAILATILVACNDDLNSIGSNIQPDGDDIYVGADTVDIKAETVSYEDRIFAMTNYGWLGEYIDPLVGKIKSDFMCEFFCARNTILKDNIISVDSISLHTGFSIQIGDTISPMAVSVYEVTSPLKPYFFTNIDPASYTDNMKTLLGQNVFSIQDIPYSVYSDGSMYKSLRVKFNNSEELKSRLTEEMKRPNTETFSDPDKFKELFKGTYITTTFGSGSLISMDNTILNIYYSYTGRNVANTSDSTRVDTLGFFVSPEVVQMNRIKSTLPEELELELNKYNEEKTYLKTPAGVYTRLTIPLDKIVQKAGKDGVINATNFRMKGYTEKEEESGLARPSNLLLINEDSLENFFFNRKSFDNVTSTLITRTTDPGANYNSYDFRNIASIINHYAEHYKDEERLPDLHYLLIPVSVSYSQSSTSSGLVVSDIYNLMAPTSAVFRTDPSNMKMSIIYSKYNSNRK